MVLRFVAGYMQRCRQAAGGSALWPSIFGEPLIFPMLVVLSIIWLLPHNPYPSQLKTHLLANYYNTLPSIQFDAHPSQTFLSRYPANKTALYIEPRASTTFLVPLLLHMIMIVPPDWRFIFLGSSSTVGQVRSSQTALMYEGMGKLHVRNLEDDWGKQWGRTGWEEKTALGIDEMTNRLLTNKTFYERELVGTEWLLTFHSDAILCANSNTSLDEWLGWDWVGAPWENGAKFGGNGGLTIRRVSKVREVLEFQKRQDDSASEDQWMSSRLGLLPNANMCPPEKEREFAVEDIWHEWPMGYHMNHGGPGPNVWTPSEQRSKIYQYCPEIKMILDMYLDREKCPEQSEVEAQENAAYRERLAAEAEEVEKTKEALKVQEESIEKGKEWEEHQDKEAARVEAAKKKLEEQEIIEKARKKLAEQKAAKAEAEGKSKGHGQGKGATSGDSNGKNDAEQTRPWPADAEKELPNKSSPKQSPDGKLDENKPPGDKSTEKIDPKAPEIWASDAADGDGVDHKQVVDPDKPRSGALFDEQGAVDTSKDDKYNNKYDGGNSHNAASMLDDSGKDPADSKSDSDDMKEDFKASPDREASEDFTAIGHYGYEDEGGHVEEDSHQDYHDRRHLAQHIHPGRHL